MLPHDFDNNDPEDFIDIDKYLDEVGTTTVRKFLGNPTYLPLADIPENELEAEIERLFDFLADHQIEVDIEECSPAEAYLFLTSELLDQEIEDPPAPGWQVVFVYAWIHQKPGEDVGP